MFGINKLQQARIGLAVSISILLLILFTVAMLNRENTSSSREVTHSAEVILTIEEIFSNLNQIESTQRGYIITQDEVFRTPVTELEIGLWSNVAHLRQLVQHEPMKIQYITELEQVIRERLLTLKKNMLAPDELRIMKGRASMDELMRKIRILKNFEKLQMERKSEASIAMATRSTTAVIISLIGAAVLILVAYFILLREYAAKADIEKQLLASQQQLRDKVSKLDMSNQDLEQFAYVASHDLQEPLRKIMTFNDRIQQKFADTLPEDARDYFNRISNAAGRMRTLIDDLLTYSRASRRDIEKSNIGLEQVLAMVKDTFEVTIQARKVRFVQTERLPQVLGDRTQMTVLFQNLIGNAIKFTLPETTPVITISSRLVDKRELNGEVVPPSHNQYYRISIADNGIGFEEKDSARIFVIFQRLHGRSEYEGTGIGLSICEKIVRNHDGYIKASSKPGQGAEFIVYLPRPS